MPQTVRVSWSSRPWEPAPDIGARALRTPLEQPCRISKKCCYSQRKLGSIFCSLSLSSTYLSHITNINPFAHKVWEVYFYKEVCSFVIIVDYVSACMCLCIVVSYNIQPIARRISGSYVSHGYFCESNIASRVRTRLLRF